jgi:hypothetical protein
VPFDDVSRDPEPESQSSVVFRRLGAPETLEDAPLVLGRVPIVSENSTRGSRGLPMVVVEQGPEALTMPMLFV